MTKGTITYTYYPPNLSIFKVCDIKKTGTNQKKSYNIKRMICDFRIVPGI